MDKIFPGQLSTIENTDDIINGAENINKINFRDYAGIYFLIYDKEIVYVGQSINVISRIEDHALRRSGTFNKFSWIQCNYEELDKWEGFYIGKYLPKYNGCIPKNPFFINFKNIGKEIRKHFRIKINLKEDELQRDDIYSFSFPNRKEVRYYYIVDVINYVNSAYEVR